MRSIFSKYTPTMTSAAATRAVIMIPALKFVINVIMRASIKSSIPAAINILFTVIVKIFAMFVFVITYPP